MKTKIARAIAIWFGCGLFPWGPGTVGSLGALLPVYFLYRYFAWPPWAFAALGIAALPLAIWAADVTAKVMNMKDPGLIVVDEVVGQWITLGGATVLNWKSVVAGFVLFRLFDIFKPFPVRSLEKLAGGTGIVMDDVGAGLYAAMVVFLMGWFKLY